MHGHTNLKKNSFLTSYLFDICYCLISQFRLKLQLLFCSINVSSCDSFSQDCLSSSSFCWLLHKQVSRSQEPLLKQYLNWMEKVL